LGIDYLALSRCVFIVGRWKYGNDVDDPARNLEFQKVTRLDARRRPTLRGAPPVVF
jgi:hypothetical protein